MKKLTFNEYLEEFRPKKSKEQLILE